MVDVTGGAPCRAFGSPGSPGSPRGPCSWPRPLRCRGSPLRRSPPRRRSRCPRLGQPNVRAIGPRETRARGRGPGLPVPDDVAVREGRDGRGDSVTVLEGGDVVAHFRPRAPDVLDHPHVPRRRAVVVAGADGADGDAEAVLGERHGAAAFVERRAAVDVVADLLPLAELIVEDTHVACVIPRRASSGGAAVPREGSCAAACPRTGRCRR